MAGLREPLGYYASSGEITIGPFLDETDGITPLTTLTIVQADVRLSKNNANFAQKNDTSSASYDADGMYSITLNANDVGVAGHMIVAIHVAGALPVWRKYQVDQQPQS